ncbi:MAG: glycosyltransferase family 2 protein, partial [Nanoarchaeota archaeon]
FGFSKAKNEWILSLDADERITDELKKEIQSIVRNDKKDVNGFWIPRKNIIFGKWIEHTGWYPDYQLRLFKKGKGKFEEKHVHEMIKLEGESGKLKSPIIHYNYENISQFLQKTLLYTENEADQLIEKGYNFAWQDSIRFPAKEFISRFFASEGYKDALHGLVLSLLMAFYHLIVFVNIWEKLKFKQVEGEQFLESVNEEFSRGQKEIFFWFSKARIDSAKNPLKKLIFKIKSKISQ